MEEKEQQQTQETQEAQAQQEAAAQAEEAVEKKQNRALAFLYDVLKGVAIGVAFIIPGFSGGSVAALLGVYERLVNAIADIFKTFKKSVLTLLPILLGMIIGIAALIFPIQWGLHHYPIPTVSLFVGLALGGIPSVGEKVMGEKFTYKNALAFLLPLIGAAGLCLLPLAGDVNLFSMDVSGYFILIAIGFIGSCALVVPGISGSMLLLIFGYYNPIVELVTQNLLHGIGVGHCFLVIGCLAAGLLIGFFAISVCMKVCLKKFPRGTYFAILGFIIGSIPAVYVSTVREAKTFESSVELAAQYSSPWYWVVSVIFLLLGAALSIGLYLYVKKKEQKK